MNYAAQAKSNSFECILDVAEDLCLHGDPGRIRQILTNLLSNAIKFTHNGRVKISVSEVIVDENTRQITFEVEDSGIGIKKDVLDKLFVPYQQGDSSTARMFGGSGLGLSISRSVGHMMLYLTQANVT